LDSEQKIVRYPTRLKAKYSGRKNDDKRWIYEKLRWRALSLTATNTFMKREEFYVNTTTAHKSAAFS
jgi:hypothetical protein